MNRDSPRLLTTSGRTNPGANELPEGALKVLDRTLRLEISLTQDLMGIIESEQQAIEAFNPDTLGQLVDKKKSVADSLAQTGARRDQVIRSLGFEPGQEGMKRLLEEHTEPQIATTWQALRSIAAQCQEHNRLLGIKISKLLLNTHQSIDILQNGHRLTQNTYGPKGGVSRDGHSSTIAKI